MSDGDPTVVAITWTLLSSYPADGYVTNLTAVGISVPLNHNSTAGETTFNVTLPAGTNVHQETKALGAGGQVLGISTKDFTVGQPPGPTNLKVQFNPVDIIFTGMTNTANFKNIASFNDTHFTLFNFQQAAIGGVLYAPGAGSGDGVSYSLILSMGSDGNGGFIINLTIPDPEGPGNLAPFGTDVSDFGVSGNNQSIEFAAIGGSAIATQPTNS